jgi:hypothetical protein
VKNLVPNVIIDKCIESGCHLHDLGACLVYSCPEAKWLHERKCPMAPAIRRVEKSERPVDPIKASKKMMKGDR